jgi:hypothetical protein
MVGHDGNPDVICGTEEALGVKLTLDNVGVVSTKSETSVSGKAGAFSHIL